VNTYGGSLKTTPIGSTWTVDVGSGYSIALRESSIERIFLMTQFPLGFGGYGY